MAGFLQQNVRRIRALLLLLIASRSSCWSLLRAFENPNPERLPAEACWSKRQIEKEEYENLRMEHLACLAGSGQQSSTTSALADLGTSQVVNRIPDAECQKPGPSAFPIADRKTGLCTWQALAHNPNGAWVERSKARYYFGRTYPWTDYTAPGVKLKHTCQSKLRWYKCPNFRHTKEWLPEIVKQKKCHMRYMTPDLLYNITGRPLKVLLHGDSLFKGTFKAFVCQLNDYVEWEKHYDHPPAAHHAEVWLASLGPLLLQYNYRDGSYNFTSKLAKSTPLLELDEFDAIVTNYNYGSGSYAFMAARRGFNGPIIGVSHACARCKATEGKDLIGCGTNSAKKLDCARRAGSLTIDFCAMTLPTGGYKAQWAPGGKVRARAPHTARFSPPARDAR
jgi:hypothetical protein